MGEGEWPFDQPRNCMVVTLRSIVISGEAILYVVHDEEDDGWMFLDGRPFEVANGALVTLGSIVKCDPTVLEVADMAPGWVATREAVGMPWVRRRMGTPTEES